MKVIPIIVGLPETVSRGLEKRLVNTHKIYKTYCHLAKDYQIKLVWKNSQEVKYMQQREYMIRHNNGEKWCTGNGASNWNLIILLNDLYTNENASWRISK